MKRLGRRLVIAAAMFSLGGCDALSELFAPVEEETYEEPDLQAGGGAPAVYQGSYQGQVRYLLNGVNGWRTSSNIQTDGGVPPSVPIGSGCIRDTYVAAAVQYAWAAESYYRLRSAQASSMAEEVNRNLQQANALCSNAQGGGVNTCRTLAIWSCPPPQA